MKLQYFLALTFLLASNGYSALRSTLRPLRHIAAIAQPVPLQPWHTSFSSSAHDPRTPLLSKPLTITKGYVSCHTVSGKTSEAVEDDLSSLPGMDDLNIQEVMEYCFADPEIAIVTIESLRGNRYTVSRPIKPKGFSEDQDWNSRSQRRVLYDLLFKEPGDTLHQSITITFYNRIDNICVAWDSIMGDSFRDEEREE